MAEESQKLKLKLTAVVEYDLKGTNPLEVKGNLEDIVGNALGNGLLTGNSDAEVDSWSVSVEDVSNT